MGAIEHDLDAIGCRSPEAEGNAALMQFRAKAHARRHAAPENARTDRAIARVRAPDGNSAPRRGSEAVPSSSVQRLYSGSVGSVNSIVSIAAFSTM
jgi:hypothetical protein